MVTQVLRSEYLGFFDENIKKFNPVVMANTFTSTMKDLRRKGLTIRSTIDCFLAQLVLDNNNSKLLHNDKDFDVIKKCRKIHFF